MIIIIIIKKERKKERKKEVEQLSTSTAELSSRNTLPSWSMFV
jgi:hypothetical protein